MHQYPIYLSSYRALEKLNHCALHLACQLEIKICQTQERLLYRGKGKYSNKREQSVCYPAGQAGSQTSPVFVKFTVSGVDGVRAGRLWLKTKER